MMFRFRLEHDTDNSDPTMVEVEPNTHRDGVVLNLHDPDRRITISWEDWETLVRAMPKRPDNYGD